MVRNDPRREERLDEQFSYFAATCDTADGNDFCSVVVRSALFASAFEDPSQPSLSGFCAVPFTLVGIQHTGRPLAGVLCRS